MRNKPSPIYAFSGVLAKVYSGNMVVSTNSKRLKPYTMKIAFIFTSNDIYYVALTGTKAQPTFNSKDKISLPTNYDIPQTVAWFETQLDLILNTLNPDKVSYKLTINNVSNNYVSNVYYGQAILNLLCHKKGILISHTSPASIVVGKFNQPKGTDLHTYLTGLIGSHPPYWDKTMRDTALIAFIQFP